MKTPNLKKQAPSERSLYRIISIQSDKIKRQAREIENLQNVHNRDVVKTKSWVAFKFFLKCLFTRKKYDI